MFERILYITTYWLFAIMVWMAMTPAKADLTYKTYAGTGAYPTFPGNGGSLYYGTVLSTGTVTSLDYNWGSGLVLDSGRNERVIVNFYGYITIPDTGSQDIQFYLYADDGVYMKIDDTVVINDWNEQGPGMWNYVSTDQTLTGGQTYYIDMWWYENGGGAAVKLYWDQTGSVALVPASTYSTTAPTPVSAPTGAQTNLRTGMRNVTHSGNAIYIQQSGDNLDLDIQQHGDDNLVAGTGTTSQSISDAVVSGDYNTVNITQGTATNNSNNNVLLFGINGDHNTMTVSQGDASGDTGGHRATIDITGGYNSIGLTQYNLGFGNGQFADININGNSNTVSSTQRETDKMLFVDVNGNSNSITTDQKDSGEHFLDITVTNNQTVGVTQQGSGDHAATINLSGYGSTLQLNQNSPTDQNYQLYQNCTNLNGCGTTTVNQN